MRRLPSLTAAVVAATMMLAGTGCDYLKARDHLNKGIASYSGADYPNAVEHFKQAIALDPDWPTPRLYLAISYMNQWIPGAQSPENLRFAAQAKEEFGRVLEQNPQDLTALGSMAMIAFNEATPLPMEEKLVKLDEAAEWHKKRIAADPTQQEAYYSLGVIAYTKWAPVWLQARTDLEMRSEDPGPLPDEEVRDQLEADYGAIIDDGIQNLQKALDIDPEYDDAMAYMNLLIREHADLLPTEEEYLAQIEIADNWLDKALETRKIKADRAAKSANTGITTGNQ